MFPLFDINRRRHFPLQTWLIIVANAVVYLVIQPKLGEAYYLSPAKFIAMVSANPVDLTPWWLLFLTMWFHGSFFHLFSNMWFLYIFGDNVEDDLGASYLPFYMLAGTVAGLVHIASNPTSTTFFVGASGAISGVLGFYMVLHPRARIATLVFVLIYVTVVFIPAWIWLLFWFIMGNLLPAISESMSYVAYWAHIGGFAFGLIAGLLIKPRISRSVYDSYWYRV